MADKDLDQKLQEIDKSPRKKYLDIILSLSTDELIKVKTHKHRYKSMVKSEILELLPEASDEQADETAQYISNLLSNEAQREKSRRLTKHDRPKTRQSKQATDTHVKQHFDNQQEVQINLTTESTQQYMLSDTFVRDLDNTLLDSDDTLNSTVTASQFDKTYDNIVDDSITEQKTVAQEQNKDKTKNNKGQRKKKDKQTPLHGSTNNSDKGQNDNEDEISCLEGCDKTNTNSGSVRCNFCMTWFHTQCVGIKNLDVIVAWSVVLVEYYRWLSIK